MTDLKAYLLEKRDLVDKALKGCFPEPSGPAADLVRAMTYSLFAGGKRLRPILCIAGAEAVGGDGRDALPAACALELIHTYSLIHDDLPVMDDDDLRRGKPTNHKVFGEAVALLAGDGLLTEAFHILANMEPPRGTPYRMLLKVTGMIAEAAGFEGMIGGQVADVQSEGLPVDSERVRYIHSRKTSFLIKAAVLSGALLSNADQRVLAALETYGLAIGLAFQIADDILNIEGDREKLGKQVGSDQERGKMTWPSAFGLEKSKVKQEELVSSALESLRIFDHRADPLREIALYIIKRQR